MMKMREVVGPNPHEFGIIYRDSGKPKEENIVSKNKKMSDERNNLLNEHRAANIESLRINFFEESGKKAKLKQLNRTVNELMDQRNISLYERRKKLKDLLINEQKSYESELEKTIVSPLERAAQQRERAKQYKLIKEKEDALFVQKKLDQKWRSECDELRTFQSKFLQSGMASEHMKQIEEKIFREQQKLEEEAVFANLWYQDIQAKKDKEDREIEAQNKKNREVAAILKEQMMVLENQRIEQKAIRAQNVKLLHEMQNIEKLEKEMLFRKKREDQAARRQDLDQCVRVRLFNEANRAREELNFDLKALEESLISFKSEDDEKAKRKVELMEEQKYYREYLRQQYEEEKIREKELEKIMSEEVEKLFQKKLNEWKKEKQARKDLLQQVLKERHQQINEKIERNRERERELEIEKLQVNDLIEHYRQQEKQEKEIQHLRSRKYGQDLQNQIDYLSMEKKMVNDHNQNEYDSYVRTENEYQRKVEEAMRNLETMKANSTSRIRFA